MRVLIVEDDPEINQLLAAYAEIAGFEPVCALVGEQALSLARGQKHGLVILDVMLPDIDGMEIARRLRNDPTTASLPIIVLTALTSDITRRRAIELGVQAFLNKPFDPDELIRVMKKWAKG